MKTSTRITLYCAAVSIATALVGCMTESTPPKSPPNSKWTGLAMDSLQNISQLLVVNGQLVIANRDSADPGVAVVNPTSEKIEAYYSEILPPSGLAAMDNRYVLATETDYAQGAVSVVDLVDKSILPSVLSFGQNNGIDTANGKFFLFDRTTGAVTGFTGHTPGKNVILDVQAGPNSNPYDVAVVGDKAFVTRYGSNSLLVLDASKLDGGTKDSIDLSAYNSKTPTDSAAAAPCMAFVTAYNGYVFVALQRLNHKFLALDTSLVAVIDASTRQVVSVIPLHFRNPIAAHAVDGVWYLTGIAGYGDNEGGVEKIDLAQRMHAGVIVTEQTLEADVFDFVPTGAHSGIAAVSTDFATTERVKKVSF